MYWPSIEWPIKRFCAFLYMIHVREKQIGRCGMKFKNLKIKSLFLFLFVAFLYPIYKYISSGNDKLLDFINTATIIGMVFLVFGILNILVLHGDFDITEYVAKRAMFRKDVKPYKAFKEDKKEEREGRFNYPLLTGILMIAVAAVLTLLYY